MRAFVLFVDVTTVRDGARTTTVRMNE